MLGKDSSPGGGGMEQAPQGNGHGAELLDFKGHLSKSLRYRV